MNKPVRSKRAFVRSLPTHSALLQTKQTTPIKQDTLRVIPLGGVEEIGINMTAYEYSNDIIIVDMGLGFPPSHIRGVNYIIPNYRWLEENKHRIRGVFVTHAHLDHIGGIPFILPRLGYPPVYSMPLSIGFIRHRITEFSLQEKVPLHAMSPDDTVRLGKFSVEFFRVNHNIPDSVGLAITSPTGTVIHTGDWKLDYTPQDEKPAELDKLARWGEKGVLALLSDSTNAKKSGYTLSEKSLAQKIDRIVEQTPGRIIFTSNALLLSRIQQVFDAAAKHNRKIAVVGRSMQNNIEVAHGLGYLKLKPGSMITSGEARRLPDKRVIVLTTGAQGEDNAGLARMARGDHREVQLKAGDTAVISATPIPGNERSMAALVSNLTRIGVQVVFHKLLDIHVSGHASQEELKLMIDLVKPKYLIPIHGELHMLVAHAELAQSIGIPRENTFIPMNGTIFEFDAAQKVTVFQQHVDAEYVFVDETSVGPVDPLLFCDQEAMANAGAVNIIVPIDAKNRKQIGQLEITSRGFIYVKGNESLMQELRHEVRKIVDSDLLQSAASAFDGRKLEQKIGEHATSYLYQKTLRRPLVLPVVVEI